MKLSKEIAEIIRKKFIEQIKLTEAEAVKWNAYLTSVNRAVKRQAYADAKPGKQRIALRQRVNDDFGVACYESIQATIQNRAFLQGIFQLLIQAAATALIAKAEDI